MTQPAAVQANNGHSGRERDVGPVHGHLDNGAIRDPDILVYRLERIDGLIERQEVFFHGLLSGGNTRHFLAKR